MGLLFLLNTAHMLSSIVTVMNSEPRTMSTYFPNYGIIIQHSENFGCHIPDQIVNFLQYKFSLTRWHQNSYYFYFVTLP